MNELPCRSDYPALLAAWNHCEPEFLAQVVREMGPVPKRVQKPKFLSHAVREMIAVIQSCRHAGSTTR